jgi:hypothetical protein
MAGKASGGIPRGLKRLWSAVFLMSLGFGIYNTCAPNSLAGILKISPVLFVVAGMRVGKPAEPGP